MREGIAVVVPWAREEQIERFMGEWFRHPAGWRAGDVVPDWLVLQHDAVREGTGVTKNKGVAEAVRRGAETVVVLDDDCFPDHDVGPRSLEALAEAHERILMLRASVTMFETVTDPPSRGTPYAAATITMPVAASMGFWTEIGDYCAVRQLAYAGVQMTFRRSAVHGRYFPLCGMNLAFRPSDWGPWCGFIDVPRFDDIWMGWLWQREAYARGYCFSLNGPLVRHSRQSNVWANLRAEAAHLEESETLWREIATRPYASYRDLLDQTVTPLLER